MKTRKQKNEAQINYQTEHYKSLGYSMDYDSYNKLKEYVDKKHGIPVSTWMKQAVFNYLDRHKNDEELI